MSVEAIPDACKVLVIGGGPGGSYATSVLAREGVDIVLLEADIFPRYHIGESMLASIRHYLRFIDADQTFLDAGFYRKVGAAFKLKPDLEEGYTDFIAAGGENSYAWNVIRSEADHLLFKHAIKQGSKAFDGVKVTDIKFAREPLDSVVAVEDGVSQLGKPVSVAWFRKSDGVSGTIAVDYIIDASGRAGLVNTKYLRNRKYNSGLKNSATWGYWRGAGSYGQGTSRANSPYFEALHDESGWCWFIPLSDGTTSVGVVMNQEIAVNKKRSQSLSPKDFYTEALKLAPNIRGFIGGGSLTSEIKNASDFSYSSSSYASPNVRIVGDAGCFIDPFFSSGVHLAMTSALSAASTICASLRGDCSEATAAKWHSEKVASGYTRFLLIVLSAYKQMRNQASAVLSDFDEDSFDKAFNFFRPIIQGTADISTKLTQAEVDKTLEFCAAAFATTLPEERTKVLEKVVAIQNGESRSDELSAADQSQLISGRFSEEEERVLNAIRARQMIRPSDTVDIESFTTDTINGLAPRLERGRLGLMDAKPLSYKLDLEDKGIHFNDSRFGDEADAALPTGTNELEQSAPSPPFYARKRFALLIPVVAAACWRLL